MAKVLCNINPTIHHVASRHNHSRPSLSKVRAMMVTMSYSNSPYLGSIDKQVESHLMKVVTVKDPVSVFGPMHHLVFSAPRKAAPALCVAACEAVGGHRDQAMAAAAALHVVHAASFTHEQLPLSDRPSLMPMSRPTVHHRFGPNIELLIADGMVPFGLELIVKSDDTAQNNSGRILRVIVEISRAIGSQGMVNGQYNELLLYNQLGSPTPGPWHEEMINSTCEKKEGGFHACAAACGAILGGGTEEEIEKLRNYGYFVGMMQGTLRQRSITSSLKNRSMRVDELRNLALKELKGIQKAKVEAISSFLEASLSLV